MLVFGPANLLAARKARERFQTQAWCPGSKLQFREIRKSVSLLSSTVQCAVTLLPVCKIYPISYCQKSPEIETEGGLPALEGGQACAQALWENVNGPKKEHMLRRQPPPLQICTTESGVAAGAACALFWAH